MIVEARLLFLLIKTECQDIKRSCLQLFFKLFFFVILSYILHAYSLTL